MKSYASDYLDLVQAVYLDACAKCPAEVSDLRDLKTIRARVEKEGLSFLTITLPAFAKDFEQALARGFIGPTDFARWRKSGNRPVFLQGLFDQVFDHETGRIYEEDIDTPIYVGAVRQVCLLLKKVELPCTPERDAAAIENFLQVEQSNEDFHLLEELRDDFVRVSRVLWDNMLGDIQPDVFIPRHGPGATAEGISGNSKFIWQQWYERLEPYFPFLGFALPVRADDSQEFEAVTFVPRNAELPVKVTLVPKTLKGPRIIAIEPVCMQYAQQAVRAVLYDRLETYWLTRGHVNFRDQTVNQELALMSSATGRYATIDLSDASDRVLYELAMTMFDGNPDLRDSIDSCRSTGACLPDGRVIGPLTKFASMGSALCFPVESMYFYTICVVALLREHNLPVSAANIYKVSRDVYVYGDDLVIPDNGAGTVLDYLQKYHCKVNSAKTFTTGRFRESCGTDAYNGVEVTPLYLRKVRPKNRQQVSELISWVATASLFYQKGYLRVAELMYCTCERILGPLPEVHPDSQILGRVQDPGAPPPRKRWSESLQSFEIQGWVPEAVYCSDKVDGYSALQKCLLRLSNQAVEDAPVSISDWAKGFDPPTSDRKHLERSVRRGAVTLKLRWVPAT